MGLSRTLELDNRGQRSILPIQYALKVRSRSVRLKTVLEPLPYNLAIAGVPPLEPQQESFDCKSASLLESRSWDYVDRWGIIGAILLLQEAFCSINSDTY